MGGLPQGNDSRWVAFSSAFDLGRAPLQPCLAACRKSGPSDFRIPDKVVGPAGEEGLAVLMLVLISVAAGFIARTALGRNLMRWSENSFLGSLP